MEFQTRHQWWSCRYTGKCFKATASTVEFTLKASNHRLVADDEYSFKTAVSKLRLDASALDAKIQEWRNDDETLCSLTNQIFKMK